MDFWEHSTGSISAARYVHDESYCLSLNKAMGLQTEWNMCKSHKYKKLAHIWILLISEEVRFNLWLSSWLSRPCF
jgi:hypothetical protein